MTKIWENNIKIRAFDVDSNNRLKVNACLDYFQDAASLDAERLTFGYREFIPKGLFWVLSWLKIEFLKFPKFLDRWFEWMESARAEPTARVHAKTTPKVIAHVLALRIRLPFGPCYVCRG